MLKSPNRSRHRMHGESSPSAQTRRLYKYNDVLWIFTCNYPSHSAYFALMDMTIISPSSKLTLAMVALLFIVLPL